MRWILIILLGLTTASGAGNIQYVIASRQVTGASDHDIATVVGYHVVTIPESVEAIVWPIPANCPAGDPLWTRIIDPNAEVPIAVDGTGLEVRPELVFLSSSSPLYANRCTPVASGAEVWAVVNEILDLSYVASTQLPALDQLNVSASIICPESNGTQDCLDVRAAMITLNAVPVNAPGQFRTFVNDAVQLRADAQALINLMGW